MHKGMTVITKTTRIKTRGENDMIDITENNIKSS